MQAFVGRATVVGFGYVPEFVDQLLGPHWPAIDLLRLVRDSGFDGRPDPQGLARHFGLMPPLNRRPPAMLGFSAALFEQLRPGRSLDQLRTLGGPSPGAHFAGNGIADEPGVYVMSGAGDRPLYVGKSVNLRRRVGSYLGSPIALSRNMHDLLQLTERIDVIPVRSELEALLLEGQLIREWQPAFNVQRNIRRQAHAQPGLGLFRHLFAQHAKHG